MMVTETLSNRHNVELMDRILEGVEHPLCRDLCRYFAAAGWNVVVEGGAGERQSVQAFFTAAGAKSAARPGPGPRLTGLDLLEMTAFLADLRIRRES